MSGRSLECHAWIVWFIARKAKLNPASVDNADIRALHMIEEATKSLRLRALASQTIADVIVHCPPDVALVAQNYGAWS